MTNARSIVLALKGRWSGNAGTCRCPSHDNYSPSLSVRQADDGRILIHCHAGCDQHDVIEALRRLGRWPDSRQEVHKPIAPRRESQDSQRIRKARFLWQQRRLIEGSPAEIYLRNARGYSGLIPTTLGFLSPAKPDHHPALIGAFGIPSEPEPGVLDIADNAVKAVHLTLLLPNGSGKARVSPNKIMVGAVSGSPIVLAPMNDLLGLTITEGIEDGLSISMATGLGVWAAGSASLMPRLGDAVPDYTDCVTICADDDAAGSKGANALAARLGERGIHVEQIRFKAVSHAA